MISYLDAKEMHEFAHVVAKMVVKELREGKEEKPEYCTLKEAAKILGMSEVHLRAIKDKFPHIKNGNNQQGRLRFLRSGLIENYAK